VGRGRYAGGSNSLRPSVRRTLPAGPSDRITNGGIGIVTVSDSSELRICDHPLPPHGRRHNLPAGRSISAGELRPFGNLYWSRSDHCPDGTGLFTRVGLHLSGPVSPWCRTALCPSQRKDSGTD